MDFLNVNTPGGSIGFIGQIHLDRRRPALLAITGAFPPPDQLHDLVSHFGGANVLVARLPGMLGAPWTKTTLQGVTEALQAAVRHLLSDFPIVALGVSTGNLVSLGLELPNIRRRIAVEPFFQTENLWPFLADSRRRIELNAHNPLMADYFWDYFGIGPDRVENRDYRHLLERFTAPSDVLVGELPLLPERPLDTWPSFLAADDRAVLAAKPNVTIHVGPQGSGHDVLTSAPDKLIEIVQRALEDLLPLCMPRQPVRP